MPNKDSIGRPGHSPQPAHPLPAYAQVLAEKGPLSKEAVKQLAEVALFAGSDAFTLLADALRPWTDDQAARVIHGVREARVGGNTYDEGSLLKWIAAHTNDADAVINCLLVEPPDKIRILRLLSRAGSQKRVFLASWQIQQKEVVLKRFIGPSDKLLLRELQPHPLSMAHSHIIETHLLYNSKREPFLVERRLPTVLDDEWRSRGLLEAANLLRDIGDALRFLHERMLVHGDVKPDNIGLEGGKYILLDFGICRSEVDFESEVSATGSLRTRAPELLSGTAKHSRASDVWALAATVYNALVGRFPLLREEEKPPRISHPVDRTEFERLLVHRANSEWDKWLDISSVPAPMQDILRSALDKSPSARPSSADLVKITEAKLAALLRGREGQRSLAPADELSQLGLFLPSADVLSLMPDARKQSFRARLDALASASGLDTDSQRTAKAILARLVK